MWMHRWYMTTRGQILIGDIRLYVSVLILIYFLHLKDLRIQVYMVKTYDRDALGRNRVLHYTPWVFWGGGYPKWVLEYTPTPLIQANPFISPGFSWSFRIVKQYHQDTFCSSIFCVRLRLSESWAYRTQGVVLCKKSWIMPFFFVHGINPGVYLLHRSGCLLFLLIRKKFPGVKAKKFGFDCFLKRFELEFFAPYFRIPCPPQSPIPNILN